MDVLLENLMREIIIIFSIVSIPLSITLFVSVFINRKHINKYSIPTADALLLVFFVNLITSILSILVSGIAILEANINFIDFPEWLSVLSRTRSVFYSIGSFLSLLAFYQIYLKGGKR